MGYGINLGNTLEACGDWINSTQVSKYETAWGSPVITREMINGYANAGFGVLRIPVAWSNLMSTDGSYTISPDYISRVKEVVEWTLDTGMFAIINIHYDSGWVNVFPENEEESMRRFTTMWTQIAEAFKNYGERLIFEAQNEELGWNSLWNQWSGSTGDDKKSSYRLVNEVNQAFVDTVRSSDGNNPRRHLLISGYNTNVELTCDELFQLPNDPVNRLAVSVHYYEPSTLTIIDGDVEWGKAKTTWGSAADIADLEKGSPCSRLALPTTESPLSSGNTAASAKTSHVILSRAICLTYPRECTQSARVRYYGIPPETNTTAQPAHSETPTL